METYLTVLFLSYVQNVAFSMVSRSRNRNNTTYHMISSLFSNTIWFLTMRELITGDMNIYILPFYVLGTILGSVTGVKVSMWVEKKIGAYSDDHLPEKK